VNDDVIEIVDVAPDEDAQATVATTNPANHLEEITDDDVASEYPANLPQVGQQNIFSSQRETKDVYDLTVMVDSRAVIEPGHLPINGGTYTMEDDARNRKMRAEEEDYVHPIQRPGRDDPRRCRGFDRRDNRPCRDWSVTNIEDARTRFCRKHAANPLYLDPSSVAHKTVHHASKAARHAAYSMVIRQQMIEAMRLGDKDVLSDVEAMDAVDVENPASVVDASMRVNAGMMARLARKFAAGQMALEDYMTGVAVFTELLRKLANTKHEITGNASDELERAMHRALERFGLDDARAGVDGDDPATSAPHGVDGASSALALAETDGVFIDRAGAPARERTQEGLSD
jgi:hypothetical protein